MGWYIHRPGGPAACSSALGRLASGMGADPRQGESDVVTWFTRQWEEHRYRVVAVVFLAVFVLGVFGWRFSDASLSWLDAVYSSLGLFLFNYNFVPGPHWMLEVARFGALAVSTWAVGSVAVRVVREVGALTRASHARDHVVIVGSGREMLQLAAGFRNQQKKVVIAKTAAGHDESLAPEKGVTCVSLKSDAELVRVLRKAALIVVVERDDLSAGVTTQRVRRALEGAPTRIITLFNDPDLTAQWAQSSGSTVVCRSTLAATSLLATLAPHPAAATAPPPIIVGDGPIAAELARLIAVGWHDPGERWIIDCIGYDRAWVDDAEVGGAQRATFRWHPTRLRAGLVPMVVQGLVARWPPPQKPDRHKVVGPRVYVVLSDVAAALPVASAVAKGSPKAEVLAVVPDKEAWDSHELPPNLILVSELAATTDPKLLTADPEALIAQELVAETRRWPGDETTALGDPDVDPAGFERRAAAVAAKARSLLAAVGVELTGGIVANTSAVLLDPEELLTVASGLAAVLPDGSDHGRVGDDGESWRYRTRLIELAAALPAIVARTGLTPVRSADDVGLGDDAIDTLAKWTHEGYGALAVRNANPTGSENAGRTWDQLCEVDRMSNVAQILDIPVKLATLGLTWETSPEPTILELGKDQVERLAEAEHRRFIHFHRSNGRTGTNGHDWDKPWDQLEPDTVKDYDREAVRTIPERLARLGWQLRPVVAPGN